MKSNTSIKLSVLYLMFVFSSCETYYYVPTNHNVLNFKEKNDASASMALGSVSRYINLGYAVTNNVAFVSDFKAFDFSGVDDKYVFDGFLWENELILFKKIKYNIYPAVNIAYGFGEFNRNSEYYNFEISRLNIQPSIGYNPGLIDIAISSKFSRATHNFSKLKEYEYANGRSFNEIFDVRDVGEKPFYFFEPAITVGAGLRFLKLRYQYIHSFKLNNANIKYMDKNYFISLHYIHNID